MKLLLLFSGLLLLAIYGDYGGKENLIGGIVCLVVCFVSAVGNPNDPKFNNQNKTSKC